ncbi:hypothetical protein LSCM4_00814 [Leishmania orientalis]|uniref:Uncharacterized protein n=1 Tax=Leishmania orientalis TaxID=2249476 RepID=A0A836KED7_9TRYP|nr:hypothetical protein LSCM4_00814 [Leishmania orientalis]
MATASTGPPRLDHGVTPVLSREQPSASQQHPANLIRLHHFVKSAGSPSNTATVPSAATRIGRPAAEPRCSSSAKKSFQETPPTMLLAAHPHVLRRAPSPTTRSPPSPSRAQMRSRCGTGRAAAPHRWTAHSASEKGQRETADAALCCSGSPHPFSLHCHSPLPVHSAAFWPPRLSACGGKGRKMTKGVLCGCKDCAWRGFTTQRTRGGVQRGVSDRSGRGLLG